MKKRFIFTASLLSLLMASCSQNNNISVSNNSTITSTPGSTVVTSKPTTKPTTAPTTAPTSAPTIAPTVVPTSAPTIAPTTKPTTEPTVEVKKTTIYLAGDSTVQSYNDDQYIAGWGQYLDWFLDDNVTVVNCAKGGRSSRSFINEGRLFDIDNSSFSFTFTENNGNSIGDVIKEGDYLFIQFGHNDDNTKMASSYTTIYDRMVPLGTADSDGIYPTTEGIKTTTSELPSQYTDLASDSEEANALSTIAKYGSEYYAYDCGGTYKWFLKLYIDFARSVGATPVLVTPVARVKFENGVIVGGAGRHGENFAYVQAVRQLAQEEDCLLIDLFENSKEMLETATLTYANYLMALKPNALTGSWPCDYDVTYDNASLGYTGIEATHYNKYGAFLQAGKVAEAILKDETTHNEGKELYSFRDLVKTVPENYINPSYLISKTNIANLEALFELVNVKNPELVYGKHTKVYLEIEKLSLIDKTIENYDLIKNKCEAIRDLYNTVNIDDRESIDNINTLKDYEKWLSENKQ